MTRPRVSSGETSVNTCNVIKAYALRNSLRSTNLGQGRYLGGGEAGGLGNLGCVEAELKQVEGDFSGFPVFTLLYTFLCCQLNRTPRILNLYTPVLVDFQILLAPVEALRFLVRRLDGLEIGALRYHFQVASVLDKVDPLFQVGLQFRFRFGELATR